MTPAEDAAIRANIIAVFTLVVLPVCLIASIVQLWLLWRTGAFRNIWQLLPAIVISPLLTIPVMLAIGWVLDRMPGGVLRGMYLSLCLAPPDLQFLYVISAPAVAAAVVTYTVVGRIVLKRARSRAVTI